VIELSLFKSSSFSAASVTAIFFSAAFGAMLLSIVLFEQGSWGWSPLRTGLAIALGDHGAAHVLSHRGSADHRFGPGLVVVAGDDLRIGPDVVGSGAAYIRTMRQAYWLHAAHGYRRRPHVAT